MASPPSAQIAFPNLQSWLRRNSIVITAFFPFPPPGTFRGSVTAPPRARAEDRAARADERAVDTLSQQLAATQLDVSDPAPAPPAVGQSEEEKRLAPDGEQYTKAQFVEFFGGETEWNGASPAGSRAQCFFHGRWAPK